MKMVDVSNRKINANLADFADVSFSEIILLLALEVLKKSRERQQEFIYGVDASSTPTW